MINTSLKQLFAPQQKPNSSDGKPPAFDLLFELLAKKGKPNADRFTKQDALKAKQSTKMDTLTAITGGGAPRVDWTPAGTEIYGMRIGGFYSPLADRVVLSGGLDPERKTVDSTPLVKQETVDNTLTHEMGHRKFFNDGMLKTLDRIVGKQFSHDDPTYKERKGMSPLEKKAHRKVDNYYQTNPAEGYAQAFVNAYDYLDKTRRNPSMEYARPLAGEYEASTPGMGSIVSDILKEKAYVSHPLRGKAFVYPSTKDKK